MIFSIYFFLTECDQTTFSYKGRCYTACPEHSFMMAEFPRTKTKADQKQASLRRRSVATSTSVPQKQCLACHPSCTKCRGAKNHECTECTTESAYREVSPNETYCDGIVNEQDNGSLKVIKLFHNDQTTNDTQNSHKSILHMIYTDFPFYTIIAYIALVIILLAVLRYLILTCCSNDSSSNSGNKKKYVYNRIAYDGTNDHVITEQEIMVNTSDSSEEIETNKRIGIIN